MNQKYHSPKDYQDAAKSELTSASELVNLAKSEYNFVKLEVARNPNVTKEILALLLPISFDSWESHEICVALAKNPKTSVETLGKLAEGLTPYLNTSRGNDMASEAGIHLFCNSNTPIDSLNQLLTSDDVSKIFKRKIATKTTRKDALILLLQDKSEAVRKRASKNIKSNFETVE